MRSVYVQIVKKIQMLIFSINFIGKMKLILVRQILNETTSGRSKIKKTPFSSFPSSRWDREREKERILLPLFQHFHHGSKIH